MNKLPKDVKIVLIIILIAVCMIIGCFIYIDAQPPEFGTKKYFESKRNESQYSSDIKEYLESKNYEEEFSNIEFVGSGKHVEEGMCDGATYTYNNGEYYRYKVHADVANIDFYVEYRTKLTIIKGEGLNEWEGGWVDNYMKTKCEQISLVQLKTSIEEILGYEILDWRPDIIGNLELVSIDIDIDIKESFKEVYTEEFLNKLKQIIMEVLDLKKTYKDASIYVDLNTPLKSEEIYIKPYKDFEVNINVECRESIEDYNELSHDYAEKIDKWLLDNIEQYREYKEK